MQLVIRKLAASKTSLEIMIGDLLLYLRDHAIRKIGGKNRVSVGCKMRSVYPCAGV